MYPKDTEKWKQFTTKNALYLRFGRLLCIPKILKNESNSQQELVKQLEQLRCCVSQRYWKMKAIHNINYTLPSISSVVVYPKDTEKWKQFTTSSALCIKHFTLLCIPKILKNESNSQQVVEPLIIPSCCCVSQRYWKMKAIHN